MLQLGGGSGAPGSEPRATRASARRRRDGERESATALPLVVHVFRFAAAAIAEGGRRERGVAGKLLRVCARLCTCVHASALFFS